MDYVSTTLRRDLVIDSIVSIHYFEYPVDFHYPGESHDFWELIYCDKGKLRIHAGDRDLVLSHGQAFLHPPEQYHNVHVADLESSNSIILSFHSDTPELYHIADRIIRTDSYMVNALFSILRESQLSFENPLNKVYDAQLIRKPKADFFASEQIIQNYIDLMLVHLIRAEHAGDRFPELPVTVEKHPLLEEVVSYMKEHLSEKLTFPMLTTHFSVSPTTMKKLFRKYYGSGTMEYLVTLRIERAKELLRKENMSCTEIAFACGFCSIHHFSKTFKEASGMSPTEYVKSVKALLEDGSLSVPTNQ